MSKLLLDECTAKVGHVKGDIGNGKVACDASEHELGRVNQASKARCAAPPAPEGQREAR